MNLDDFPFDNFLKKGEIKEIKPLLMDIQAYVMKMKIKTRKQKTCNENKYERDEDTKLIAEIANIYVKLGCVKEDVTYLMATIHKYTNSNIVWKENKESDKWKVLYDFNCDNIP